MPLSVSVSVPVRLPPTVGAKATSTVQLVLGATEPEVEQLPPEATEKLLLGVMAENLSGAVPGFEMVTAWAALVVFATCGDGRGDRGMIAVRLGGKGNVTKTHLAWEKDRGTPYVPTPIYKNGLLFYTSELAPTYPLLVVSTLTNLNAIVTNAVISGVLSTSTSTVPKDAPASVISVGARTQSPRETVRCATVIARRLG